MNMENRNWNKWIHELEETRDSLDPLKKRKRNDEHLAQLQLERLVNIELKKKLELWEKELRMGAKDNF